MKRTFIILVSCCLLALNVFAEGRISYDSILEMAAIAKKIEINGETYVRFYVKPKNPEISIETVFITIQRDGTTLNTPTLAIRTIGDESVFKDYPWEVLLPVGKKYVGGAELVHNLEPGALKSTVLFFVTRKKKGSGITIGRE